MEALRMFFTLCVTLHALFVTTKEATWKEKRRPWVMVVGLALSLCLVATTAMVDNKSKTELADLNSQLAESLRSLQQKSTALEHEIRKGHDLEREIFSLQKKSSEAAELARKKQAETYAKKESARRLREENFLTPLNQLIYQAHGTIRMMNESFFTTEYFMGEATKWFGEMLTLLKKHCSDERIANQFQYPHRQAGVPGIFSSS